jgi:hypothetical protein
MDSTDLGRQLLGRLLINDGWPMTAFGGAFEADQTSVQTSNAGIAPFEGKDLF